MSKLIHIPRHSGGPAFVDRQNPVNWDYPVNKGTVGWWLALQSGGTQLRDLTGGNVGTLRNGLPWTTRPGSKFPVTDHDGTNKWVDISTANGALNLTTQLSISIWFNLHSTPSTFMYLVTRNTSSTPTIQYGLVIRDPGTNDELGLNLEGTSYNIGVDDWQTDRLYHLVTTWDGAAVNFYVDGVFKGTTAASPTLTERTYVSIGRRSNSPGGTLSSGLVDGTIGDVRIYDHAISASQVLFLYQDGLRDYVSLLRRRPITYFIPVGVPPSRRIFVVS